ncbi:MAG: hypothetical protein CME62_12850 [Halobacteriovoraceae bacterium]|nr:hypothetical protein [Halobacteriovoraceae bacterium]|tara:strand:+ start:17052 stop:17576 length:525 start_codon:yes stop_codon:yes gene_type:complete
MNNNKPNKTKFYVTWSLVAMFLVSLTIALVMVSNYKKDDSKQRYKLTQIYKDVKDSDYQIDMKRGAAVYQNYCLQCHGQQAQGLRPYPALAGSETLQGPMLVPLKIVLHGIRGNRGIMPGYKNLNYLDITHVLNYVRNNFGNHAETIHPVETIKAKIDTLSRKTPYTRDELNSK